MKLFGYCLLFLGIVSCSSTGPTPENQKELLQEALEEVSDRPKLSEGDVDFKNLENHPPAIQWNGWSHGDSIKNVESNYTFEYQLENLEENAILYVRINEKPLGIFTKIKDKISIPASYLQKGPNILRMHLETPLGALYPFESSQKIIVLFVDDEKPSSWNPNSPLVGIGNPVGNYTGRKSKIGFRYFSKNSKDLRIRYTLGKVQRILPAIVDEESLAYFLNLKPGTHTLSVELIEKNSLAPLKGVGTRDKVNFTIQP